MDQKEMNLHMLNMHRAACELEHELEQLCDRVLTLRNKVTQVRVSVGSKLRSIDEEPPKPIELSTIEQIHALLNVSGEMPVGQIARTIGLNPDLVLGTLSDSRYFKRNSKSGRWGLRT